MLDRELFDRVFGPVVCEIASSRTYLDMLEIRKPTTEADWYRVDTKHLESRDIERLAELGFIQTNEKGWYRFPPYNELRHLRALVQERVLEYLDSHRVRLRDRMLRKLF